MAVSNSGQPTWDELLDRHLGKSRDIRVVYKDGQNDLDIESMLAIKEVFNILEKFVDGNTLQIDNFFDAAFNSEEHRIKLSDAELGRQPTPFGRIVLADDHFSLN